jgi:hypothetical protein
MTDPNRAAERIGPVAWLQYAAFVNGRCERCGRILPHPKSERKHECKAKP